MNQIGFIFVKFLGTLPFALLIYLGEIFNFLMQLLAYRKDVIKENLKKSFPNKTLQEITIIQNRFYKHLSQVIIEVLKMFHITESEIIQRVQFKNKFIIEEYYNKGKDVILVLGHYGNWEWGLLATSLISQHEMVGVYKPLKSSFWDAKIKAIRAQFGATLIPKKESIRYLLKKSSKPRLIGLIGDQTPTLKDANYWTPFLNQETAVFSGTEKLAKKLQCPVVFVHIDKKASGYYEMSFEVITENPELHPEGEITNLHTKKLEQKIQKRPELWLWSHRRWKHKRK